MGSECLERQMEGQNNMRDADRRRSLFRHLSPNMLAADWSSLPLVILSEILEKLLEPPDRLRFATLCKEWCALAKDYNRTTTRKMHSIPMLMVPSESKGKRKLYSVSEQKLYKDFELPEFCSSSKRCCGSTTNAPGWLITVHPLGQHQFSITLVNVFNRQVTPIRLPPLDFKRRIFLAPKVILSADPIENQDSFVVVAIYDRADKLAFIRGGETSWSCVEDRCPFFTDAVFHKRKVYTVGSWGQITWFDIHSKPVERRLLRLGLHPSKRFAIKGYLVETTNGDLLHVRRFLKEKGLPPGFYNYQNYEFWTESFKVYKVVFDESDKTIVEEIELQSIGDEALFVGDNHSMCVSASNFPGCQANSIYFTDDLVELGRLRIVDDGSIEEDDIISLIRVKDETMTKGPSDMGIFNIADGSFTQHYSLNPWHKNIPPAIWIVPLFNF